MVRPEVFFSPQRGLQQGCPLSPLLFLLVVKGLSLMLHAAKREGNLRGIEVAVNLWVTHLLFVDDILLFSNGSPEDWRCLKEMLDLFLKETGLRINEKKYSLTTAGLLREELGRIVTILNFEIKSLQDPFKHLGFILKPDSYLIKDWKWLIANIEGRMHHWSYKWLSRVGRLVLIKLVAMAIPVYWASLSWVPKNILTSINKICSRFL